MNKTLILLFIVILCVGCLDKPNCNIDPQVLKSNDSILAKVKSEKTLSVFLDQMNEPELDSHKNEVYRFMIIGPWGNNKFYTIKKSANDIIISSKKYWKYDDEYEIEIDSLGKEKNKKINTSD